MSPTNGVVFCQKFIIFVTVILIYFFESKIYFLATITTIIVIDQRASLKELKKREKKIEK
jgi:hypothetical protein